MFLFHRCFDVSSIFTRTRQSSNATGEDYIHMLQGMTTSVLLASDAFIVGSRVGRHRASPSSGVASRVVRSASRVAKRRRASHAHLVAVAAAAPNDIHVSFGEGEASANVPGVGGVVGSGGKADAVVKGDDVDEEHAKLEIRQGRIFVTALSRDKGTFLSGSRLFPGVAYAVADGGVILLGEGDSAVTMTVEQAGEVAGDAGVDMMANLMKMQFEATMSPEVKAALDGDK